MDFSYALIPFFAWLAAGTLKFFVNSVRAKQWAFGMVGYGGFPSNHSAIVSSTATLIGLREGVGHPAFGVALSLAFIVILDASSLRRQIGKQAEAINRLSGQNEAHTRLRERMGHSRLEIAAGIAVGCAVAVAMHAGVMGYS